MAAFFLSFSLYLIIYIFAKNRSKDMSIRVDKIQLEIEVREHKRDAEIVKLNKELESHRACHSVM